MKGWREREGGGRERRERGRGRMEVESGGREEKTHLHSIKYKDDI